MPNHTEVTIRNTEELGRFAAEFLRSLAASKTGATVIGLTGDLGSGKTAFTKALGRVLGVVEEITSPTFAIARFYDLRDRDWKRLIHADAYRIEDPAELIPLKWDALLSDPSHFVVVEWPERLGEQFPHDAHMLQFTFIDEHTRRVEWPVFLVPPHEERRHVPAERQ